MKKLLCMLLGTIFIMPTITFAADGEIDYPHFMYRMEVSDFGEDFATLGKHYESLPIIVPFEGYNDSYTLRKSETNEYVEIVSDGYAGGGEDCYETLVNAVEAYFGAEAEKFVRDNFDYTEFKIDGKMDEKIGDYYFQFIKGNNHTGFIITVKRSPIFIDLVDNESLDVNHVFDLVGEGIIKGMGDGTFAPDANITRAQFAAMFTRLIGVDGGEYKGFFTDVPEGEWFTGAVEAIADTEYVKGYGDGAFHPDDTITYQDMFVVAYRYLLDNDLLPADNRQSIDISDYISGISDYAKSPIDELYARSLIEYAYLETAREPSPRIHIAVFLNGIRLYKETQWVWGLGGRQVRWE